MTYYLFALMISIASLSESAQMTLRTGPKISFLNVSFTKVVVNYTHW